MLTHEHQPRNRAAKTAPPAAVHRCGSWHGSSANCPCHLDRLTEPGSAAAHVPVPTSVGDTVRERGSGLDEPTRRRMQARLGHDFGGVRVHAGERAAASARSVRALAYTVGEHVVLDRDRLPTAQTERDAVLAHELVHTVQHGPLGGRRIPDRVSDPSGPAEREAHDLSGSAAREPSASAPAGTLHRDPKPGVDPVEAGLTFSIRADGRLEVVATGPKAPVVGKAAAGLRRNPDGTYTVVFGAGEKVVAPSEIPPMLRGMVKTAENGTVAPRSFRIPTCASLRRIDGTGWTTFRDYQAHRLLSPDLMELTPTFFNELIGKCATERTPPPTAPLAVPPAPSREAPHEDLPPVLPAGEAYA